MATVGGSPLLERDPDVRVEWVSWEGRPPGSPFAPYSPEQRLENFEKNHKGLAAKYDVPIRPAGGNYRTTSAHLATFYAREQGKFREFRDRVYQARWVDDANLESPDVLAGLGEEIGLSGAEIKRVVAEQRYLAILHSQRAQGKGLGIYGIPSFIVRGKIFWGKDVIDDVRQEVARLKQDLLEKQKQSA